MTEWSRASYGPLFEEQGGGILAMKWDENDISVCTSHGDPTDAHVADRNIRTGSFFRAAIPTDVTQGAPNPSLWGAPSAILRNTMCDIESNFTNHVIVFGARCLVPPFRISLN